MKLVEPPKEEKIKDRDPTMLNVGNIVYAKKVWKIGRDVQLEFNSPKGVYTILVLIGELKDKNIIPTPNQIHQLLGAIGLIRIDDVEEALGKEATEKLIKFLQEKYS